MVDRTTAKIVDLAAYRKRRATGDLPLFESLEAEPTHTPPPPADTRSLAPRQVEHRQRMLAHLSGAMLSKCRS